MAEQPTFDNLTTAEVKNLYKQTREAAQKQRGIELAQAQGRNDFGLDGESHQDQFGNILPGPKPPTKHIKTYVDSSGYVQELRAGESAPATQGKTVLEQVTKFVNEHAEDEEIQNLLPKDLSIFEEQSTDYPELTLLGTLRGKKWYVTALNEHDDARGFRFVLSNDLDRDSAIAAAHNYLETRIGPKFRELSQTDLNLIQRTSVIDRNEAMLIFLRGRLPLPWALELENLIVESASTGDTRKVLEFVSEPAIHPTLEEAIFNVFFWNRPSLDPTDDLKEFLQIRTANTVLTFPLLDTLLKKFQTGRAMDHLGVAEAAAAAPSQEDLEGLSDEQVADLFDRTRMEAARSRR